jgi:hypothetical protein
MSQYYEIRVLLFHFKNKFRLSLKQIGLSFILCKKEKNFAFTYILTISPLYTHFLSLSPPPSYLPLFLCIALVFPFLCIFVCTYLQFYSVFGSFTFCHLVYHYFFSIILSVFLFSIFFSAYSLERRF